MREQTQECTQEMRSLREERPYAERREARAEALWEPGHTLAWELLLSREYPWQILPDLGEFLIRLGNSLPGSVYEQRQEQVWVAVSARVAPTVSLTGPCIICEESEVRHGAFVRGNVLVGRGAVVGNSVELKNCILFDRAQVPHFNYVGDSVLGYCAHLGAGAVTSNVRGDRGPVSIHLKDGDLPTGLKKCGAMLGDFAEIGCNSVLNPGTVIGRNSTVYPSLSVRGTLPPGGIFKDGGRWTEKQGREN